MSVSTISMVTANSVIRADTDIPKQLVKEMIVKLIAAPTDTQDTADTSETMESANLEIFVLLLTRKLLLRTKVGF